MEFWLLAFAFVHHDLANIAMTPIQWFPEIIEWIFGDDNGFQVYISIALGVGNEILPSVQLGNTIGEY